MIAPARTTAFYALRAIENRREDLPAALAKSRTRLRDLRDQALTAEIVIGTLRWQRRLDHLIVDAADRELSRIDPSIVLVLRLSLYQLLHLDRVPAAAVVDDAVNLARAARRPHATGFVNAVLRTLQRRRADLPLPPRPDTADDRAAALAYLGVTWSHPEWLVARWLDRYGFDATESWVRFDNVAPALCLRANRLRANRNTVAEILQSRGVHTEPTTYAPDGLLVRNGRALDDSEEVLFAAQDEASQLVGLSVQARPGERVLDLCAAPGGKAAALIADMRDSGMLVACDVRPRRIDLLTRMLARTGTVNTRVVRVSPDGSLPFGSDFDRVLIDAPCSGLGTLRRDPDIRWRRVASDLPALAESQHALLARAASVVRRGGRLVYATCSSEPEENEQVAERFLATHEDFSRVNLQVELPASLSALVDSDGALRTLPFAHGLEAFFAVALARS